MYTIIGIDSLCNWLYTSGNGYWAAYDNETSSRKKVGDNFQLENATVEDGIRTLRAFMDNYSTLGARLYIWSIDKPSNTRGGAYTWFKLPGIESAGGAVSGIGSASNFVSKDDVAAAVQKALADYQVQQELAAAKAKIAELERLERERQPSATERIIERIAGAAEPVLPQIMQNLFPMNPQAAAVAGVDDPEIHAKLEAALAKLFELDPEAPILLIKISELIQNKPETYAMAKGMLKSQ